LARALRGGDTAALLVSYEQERREAVISQVERITDFLTRHIMLSGKARRAVFLGILRQAMKAPIVMRALIRRMGMLATSYPESTVLNGDGLLVGHRAPDAPVTDATGQELRILDLVSPHATLLLFDDRDGKLWDVEEVRLALSAVPDLAVKRIRPRDATVIDANDVIDLSGQVARQWLPAHRQAALLRPDGHVGWMLDDPDDEDLIVGCSTALGALPASGGSETGRAAAEPTAPDEGGIHVS
jgi:hypothetical protein